MAGHRSRNLARGVFNFVAGLSSIAGLVILLFKREEGIIALICFCVFLLCVLLMLLIWVIQMMKQEKPDNEWLINFVFINYLVIDDIHHEHDIYKIIQCKRPYLTHIWHRFKWSGSIAPRISSKLQDVEDVITGYEDDFDRVKLLLKHPLSYNQMTTLHFHTDMDDSDGSAEPYLGFRVDSPMSMILFTVTLKNKDDNYANNAVVERIPLRNTTIKKPQAVASVVFDRATKSYSYALQEPEPGFFYRLHWQK